LRLGLEPSLIAIVGDDEQELERALAEGLRADLCVVSGGLGPTHDDRTVEFVARAAGVGLHVDEELRAEIERISRAVAERLRRPYADFEAGVVKQATIPDGAVSLGLAGTAPGLELRERLARNLFAEEETSVEAVVLQLCRARGWTLATAESATGGMIAERLTSVPGSSDVFVGAVVAYANEVKERELDVPADVLRT